MADLILYCAPDNASLVVRLALEERGLAYDTHMLDRRTKAHKGPDYLAINPVGRIPALKTPDGVMFETGAILIWLGDTYGGPGPAPSSSDRADYLKWLIFVATTVHAELRLTFYPDTYVGPSKDAQTALRTGVRQTLNQHFALLDDVVQQAPDWCQADAPSPLAYYIAACTRWAGLYPQGDTDWFDLNQFDALKGFVTRLEERPAVKRAALDEGWNATPFSAPAPARPPAGSAL